MLWSDLSLRPDSRTISHMNDAALTVLIPSHGLEDFPTDLAEKPAASLLNAFSVIWHPALLASRGTVPTWRRADDPSDALPGSFFILPTGCDDLIPGGWVTQARQAGAVVITGEHDRSEMLQQALSTLSMEVEPDPELVADFLALGTVFLQLELLTRRMRNYSNYDEHRLKQEAVAAARAAMNNDPEAARKYLSTCFEIFLESRERFYPVECTLLDLCLASPQTWPENLSSLLVESCPTNLLIAAQDLQEVLSTRPEDQEMLRQAVAQKQVEFLGGDDVEQISSLLSLDDTIWHLQQGNALLRDLVGEPATVWARRRFGLSAQIPQLLQRSGYSGALHTLLDDGLSPEDEQSHLLWDGCSGNAIDAYSRIPLPGDSARSMLKYSERMAESMDYDHSAAIVFARWPVSRTPFLEDIRRAHRYASVLGKFERFSDYFAQVSSPGRRGEFQPSTYFSPALIHAAAREETNPVSRYLNYWRRERRFLRAEWLTSVSQLVSRSATDTPTDAATTFPSSSPLEKQIRSAHPESSDETRQQAEQELDQAFSEASTTFRDLVTSGGVSGAGVLVINTHSFPRKVLVEWPDKGSPPRDPSILGRQTDERGTKVLVALPPCGFVWLASQESPPESTSPGKLPMAEELLLRNDQFEVRLSDTTGGIAQIGTYRRSPNRLSQQIAIRFPHEKTIHVGEGEERETYTTYYTAMQLRESRILSAGPLVGEIGTLGDLIDEQTGQVLGTYQQWTRVVSGRNVVEVDLELSLAHELKGDPWTNYAGCRFAWRHEQVALSGSYQQGAHRAARDRIESPQFIEIADDDFRTTILTPGLPFHRKTGERMLDTLLVTEGESERRFQFAVAIDAVYPMQAHLDQFSPPVVMTTSTRPVEGKREGWFFHLSAANVQLQRVRPGIKSNTVQVRLLETEGRARNLKLHCFRTPVSARQIDFRGEMIQQLQIDNAVTLEVSPYEICDIELQFE